MRSRARSAATHFFPIAALLVVAAVPARSADIKVNPPQTVAYDCDVNISGEIKPGDAARAERAMEPLRQRTHRTVCLDSTGGAYNEGIALADLFRRFAFSTRLLPRSRCFSSCAIAFMGGTWDTQSGEGYSAHRLMSPSSRLGFHAPYLRMGGDDFNEESVRSAYSQATNSIGRLLDTSLRIDLDLKLVQEMLFRGHDQLYMIDTFAKLGVFGIGLHGYFEIPRFPGMEFHGCRNFEAWSTGRTLAEIYADGQPELSYDEIRASIGEDYNAFVANPAEFGGDGVSLSFQRSDYSVDCKFDYNPAEVSFAGVVTQTPRYTEVAGENWEVVPELHTLSRMPAWAMLDAEIAISELPEGPIIDLSMSMNYRQ